MGLVLSRYVVGWVPGRSALIESALGTAVKDARACVRFSRGAAFYVFVCGLRRPMVLSETNVQVEHLTVAMDKPRSAHLAGWLAG